MGLGNRSGWTHVRWPYGRRSEFKCTVILGAVIAVVSVPCSAQTSFFANKTITLAVGATAGGGYDVYARAIAPFLTVSVLTPINFLGSRYVIAKSEQWMRRN